MAANSKAQAVVERPARRAVLGLRLTSHTCASSSCSSPGDRIPLGDLYPVVSMVPHWHTVYFTSCLCATRDGSAVLPRHLDKLEVRVADILQRTDTEIARAVRWALEWDAFAPDRRIQSSVSNGWVTLAGVVEKPTQREDAEHPITHTHTRNLAGVRGVTNDIACWARRRQRPTPRRPPNAPQC